MENLVGTGLGAVYQGRNVLVTGHTGFKGGWLALWLSSLGASVTGYALEPPTEPSLFEAAGVALACRSIHGDVRDLPRLLAVMRETRPSVVFHLAAQSLVRRSYEQPFETIETNVTGTAGVLEAIRREGLPCAVIVVTSDKCYENREWARGYREDDALGGYDVYSMSKSAAELVAASYRRSFFPPERLREHGVAISTARAGNVIGGGDWAVDRIVPDAVKALVQGRPVPVRRPGAIRPWQHVLEPLGGYLLLGARLLGFETDDPARFCGPWNFGPRAGSDRPVSGLVEALIRAWGGGSWTDVSDPGAPHEASHLALSTEKARQLLGWQARWDIETAVDATVEWYRAFFAGESAARLQELCSAQVVLYSAPGAA